MAGLPADLRQLSPVPVVDYADVFTLVTDVLASPEDWARAMFGDVPNLGERFIWNALLHLRLDGSMARWLGVAGDGRGVAGR